MPDNGIMMLNLGQLGIYNIVIVN
eukprot:SAG11_NODE_8038_length_1066_cov_1.421923_1_plen_23_part_01